MAAESQDRSDTLEQFTSYHAALTKLFESGDHSDLTLTCADGTDFKVHKTVLCSQSSFFANACRPGGFKEAIEGIVKLEDTETHVVRAMLEYLYSLTYDIGQVEGHHSPIVFHAKMYAAADFLDIPPLKLFAKKKFQVLSSDNWRTPDYLNALRLAFESTPATDLGLREIAGLTCAQNFAELLAIDGFTSILSSVPGLGKEISIVLAREEAHLRSRWGAWKQYKCPNCYYTWASTPRKIYTPSHCALCKRVLGTDWAQYEVQDS